MSNNVKYIFVSCLRREIVSANARIREIRNTLGFTQQKFAERIAISISYLAEIEYGNRVVTERIIRLISLEFNIDSCWIRTGDGTMFIEDVDAQISKLISAFKLLNYSFKECAISQVESLVELNNQIKSNQ